MSGFLPKRPEKFITSHQHDVNIACLLLMALMFMLLAFAASDYDPVRNFQAQLNITVLLISMAMILILAISYGTGNFGASAERNLLFLLILFFMYVNAFFCGLYVLMEGSSKNAELLRPVYSMCFIGMAWVTSLVFAFDQTFLSLPHKQDRMLTLINRFTVSAYTLMMVLNAHIRIFFYVDDSGKVVFLPAYLFVPFFYLAWSVLYSSIIFHSDISTRNKTALLSYKATFIVWGILDTFRNPWGRSISLISLYTLGAFLSMFLIFCYIQVELSRKAMEQERDLAKSELNALMMQINPHFIYNALGSIYSLCGDDPPAAQRLIKQFSTYLQSNYADLGSIPMISFREELEHLRQYLSIEQVRFPGLRVEFDIQEEDFMLPTFSVQPLVENAVRHGISKKPGKSGLITISSRKASSAYIITVEDDGAGFSGAGADDGRTRIGVNNVGQRLKLLCGGTLLIEGSPGKGTVCTVVIPLRSGDDEDDYVAEIGEGGMFR